MIRPPRVLAALAALLLSSCTLLDGGQPPRTAAADPRPALWKIADADTTIYLFGTIHVLPKDYPWIDKALQEIVDSADSLTIETVLDPDQAKAAALLLKVGLTPGLPPLIDRVPADKKPALQAMMARAHIPAAALDQMDTWAAGLMLVGVTLGDLGLSPDTGVEPQLEARFTAAGKPVGGLETPEEQLGYFDSLPEGEQRLFLETLLDDAAKARAEFDVMLGAWARGDEAAIAASFDDELEASPMLRAVLLKGRNARWADALKARLEKPGTVFVAVGAGHLAGPDSVQAMLVERGVSVARLR